MYVCVYVCMYVCIYIHVGIELLETVPRVARNTVV